jgi:two-component system sporulation sensor kinase B
LSIIRDFLLQFSLVIVPFGIYIAYLFGHLRIKKHIHIFLLALWGSSIMLCISFPVSYGNSMNHDFRIVPLLIGTLYGGRKTGVILAALVILYRLYFYGVNVGSIISFLAIIIGFSPILYFQKKFEKSSKGNRIKIAIMLSGFYCLTGASLVGIFRGVSAESIIVQIAHFGVAAGFAWLMIVLIENMAEIYTMRKEIHNAERLRLIGDLTGVFAHEIRNPMQVARGFLQLLDTPDLPASTKKQYIKLSIEELDQANDIIREFLLLGKPPAESNEDVNVGNQLERTVKLIQNYALSKNVSIETKIDVDCMINGNTQRLNQFLLNIMKNAIESMPDGGTMVASCYFIDDSHIEIRVKDEGIGMSKHEVERLGSPYYSLKESGTGLGMMVSFQIIESFAGKLHVFSEKNKGTEVVAIIPVVR